MITKPKTLKKNQEEKRTHLLHIALELFANKGYHLTTIAELANTAGISKGSVYTYFPSKEELLRSLVSETYLVIFNTMDLRKDGQVSETEFFGILDRIKKWITTNQKFLRLYFSILMQPKVLGILEEELNQISSPYLEELQRFFSAHGFSDAALEVSYFGSLLDGISLNYLANPDHFPLDKALDRMMDYYRNLFLHPT